MSAFYSLLLAICWDWLVASSPVADMVLGLIFMGTIPFVALAVYGVLTHRFPAERDFERETRCRKCGYILRGISEPRCPECGEKI